MVWKPDLHPRDEFGRFKLKGSGGILDRMAAQAEAHHYARVIADYRANQAAQDIYWHKREAGTLTPEENADWDRLVDEVKQIVKQLPEAHRRGMVPYQNGAWYVGQDRYRAYDAQARLIPPAAMLGWVRVGDDPRYADDERRIRRYGADGPGGKHPAAGGLWYKPGEYYPGMRVPVLYSDEGHPLGELATREALQVAMPRSRRHRERSGAFVRMEDRLERYPAFNRGAGDRAETEVRRRGKPFGRFERESSDMTAGRLLDPRQPLSRKHTARTKRNRKRKVATTWIQLASDQIGRSRGEMD